MSTRENIRLIARAPFCNTQFLLYVYTFTIFLFVCLQDSLGSLVCYVLLSFCHFPMWCPESGVVLDCIDC